MASHDYSGEEIYRAMLKSGVSWWHDRTVGSHAILKWRPPDHHDGVEPRTVSVPLNDHIPIGTLRGIADDAGAEELEDFTEWIDDNL